MDCIFCSIVKGTISSEKIYEDDKVIAFNDISPQAPVHIIIIPKEHVTSIVDINNDNMDIISHITKVTQKIAKDLGIDKTGFRLVTNCGDDGGQTVKHLHFHLLGGRSLQWPPG